MKEAVSGTQNVAVQNVAVLGARGYSGAELARLLLTHPQAKLKGLFATQAFASHELLPEVSSKHGGFRTSAGISAGVVPAGLGGVPPGSGMDAFEADIESAKPSFDTVFLATPADVSLQWAPKILKKGVRVVDLSGAFRLKGSSEADSKALYSKWYGLNHTELGLVQEADYGLVPFANLVTSAPSSGLIANPGCYASATALAMIPLYKADLIRLDTVSVDAKSGTTGAGKKAEERLLHAEVDGGCLPYRVGRHQHEPEIAEAVARFAWNNVRRVSDVSFSFVPHLLPVRRGIIVSVHARLKPGVTESHVTKSFEEVYGAYPLARLASLSHPGTERELVLRRVVGSARTVLAWHVRGDQLVVFSLIDNLLKGAASQAVENFNRFLGLAPETTLIEREGVL